MVLSFLLVFFGIRCYRENIGQGVITFGRAFSVGILITIISCLLYVVTWEIVYFKLMPGFADKYVSHVIDKVKASGASQQEIDASVQEMKKFKRNVRQAVGQRSNQFHRAISNRPRHYPPFVLDTEE